MPRPLPCSRPPHHRPRLAAPSPRSWELLPDLPAGLLSGLLIGILAALLLVLPAAPAHPATDGAGDLTVAAQAQTGGEGEPALAGATGVEALVPLPGPFPAADHELGAFQWTHRVLAVFADTPNDPSYLRQLEIIAERPEPLAERDVIVLTDTAPADATPLRQTLRPRGFAVVIVDKDGRVLQRRPSPWGVREITRLIDSTPLRRQ